MLQILAMCDIHFKCLTSMSEIADSRAQLQLTKASER